LEQPATLKTGIFTSDARLLVRKDMDVNEHEKLYNLTLRHKLK